MEGMMLIPAARLLDGLHRTFRGLMPRLADSQTDGSAAQAVAHGLGLLRQRSTAGAAWYAGALANFGVLLDRIDRLAGAGDATLETAVAPARAALPGLADTPIELGWEALTGLAERLVVAINAAPLADDRRRALCTAIVEWEESALLDQLGGDDESATGDHAITQPRIEAYLRDRFNDPAITVATFQPLAGGFGKETIIFAAEGALSGEFVVRRDLGDGVSLANDCHEIAREYPVIQALHSRGFPAPEALWLDTEHALLPGGDFIVMRRSPGTLGGNVFGAQTTIASSLAATLAGIAARLHALPPLTELGDLASFILGDLWSLSRTQATEHYIRGWYDYYLSEAHSGSPALAAIYGWLLDNIPDRPGRACFLHGDLGFHNFLFDQGELSAVLDWEFAHIGDPAEELGYIKLTVGDALDWDAFMNAYVAAGGDPIDPAALHFFQVWGYARNASAANIFATRFSTGAVGDLKLTVLPYHHYTRFIRGAEALISTAV
jgi:aminoglycoside phosphotransferase (APT) family kinase protein